MAARPQPPSVTPLSPRRRLAAWLVTGPVGHLVAGIADWLLFVGRMLRRRLSGSPSD